MKSQKIVLLGAEPASLINFRAPLIKRLVALGHEIHVAAKPAPPELIAALVEMGATFQPVTFARTGMNPFRDLKTIVSLYSLFRTLRPDAVMCYTSKPVIYGAFAAFLANVPRKIAMITGLGYSFIDGSEYKRSLAKMFSKRLYSWALPLCTTVLFQNNDDRNEFDRLKLLKGVARVAVVNGSGVDTNHFTPVPLPEQPVFLMIARLLADKGVREFAAAAGKVRYALPHAKFQLLGAIDTSPNAISAQELKLWQQQGIVYLGETKDVRPFISAASIIVLPSYREGTPRSVLEGMAMGRAIITTDVPGCRETVMHGQNGLLVPVRDVETLAAAIVKLAKDAEEVVRMGKRSRQIALSKYEAETVAKDTARKAGFDEEAAA